jgi:hypothetical protein
MNEILDELRQADDLTLQSMWSRGHGLYTSWSILIGSKTTPFPQYHITDTGNHRFSYTDSGILIDSSIRLPIQLQANVAYIHNNMTYTFHETKERTSSLSYSVSLSSKVTGTILIWK